MRIRNLLVTDHCFRVIPERSPVCSMYQQVGKRSHWGTSTVPIHVAEFTLLQILCR